MYARGGNLKMESSSERKKLDFVIDLVNSSHDRLSEYSKKDVKTIDDANDVERAIKVLSSYDKLACYGKFTLETSLTKILLGAENGEVYSFDLKKLGSIRLENGLKAILENEEILKIMFDSRTTSVFLWHNYNVKITNIFDLQLLVYIKSSTDIAALSLEDSLFCATIPYNTQSMLETIETNIGISSLSSKGLDDLVKIEDIRKSLVNKEDTSLEALDVVLLWELYTKLINDLMEEATKKSNDTRNLKDKLATTKKNEISSNIKQSDKSQIPHDGKENEINNYDSSNHTRSLKDESAKTQQNEISSNIKQSDKSKIPHDGKENEINNYDSSNHTRNLKDESAKTQQNEISSNIKQSDKSQIPHDGKENEINNHDSSNHTRSLKDESAKTQQNEISSNIKQSDKSQIPHDGKENEINNHDSSNNTRNLKDESTNAQTNKISSSKKESDRRKISNDSLEDKNDNDDPSNVSRNLKNESTTNQANNFFSSKNEFCTSNISKDGKEDHKEAVNFCAGCSVTLKNTFIKESHNDIRILPQGRPDRITEIVDSLYKDIQDIIIKIEKIPQKIATVTRNIDKVSQQKQFVGTVYEILEDLPYENTDLDLMGNTMLKNVAGNTPNQSWAITPDLQYICYVFYEVV